MASVSFQQRHSNIEFGFWHCQVGGWVLYFCFTTLASIDVLGSLRTAVLVNGAFTVLGLAASSGLHKLFSLSWDKSTLTTKLLIGAIFSFAASAVIMPLINIKLWPYLGDLTISGDNWTILFRGTLKYGFVFMAWVGLYLGGRYWREAERQKKSGEVRQDAAEQSALTSEDTIFISDSGGSDFVKVGEITHITADDSYTSVFLQDGSRHLILKSLKEWEQILDETYFKRVHRSCIVNVSYVCEVKKWFNNTYRIYLEGSDEPVAMSRRYASDLKFR